MGVVDTKSGHGSLSEDESKTSCATCCPKEIIFTITCVNPSGVYVALVEPKGC